VVVCDMTPYILEDTFAVSFAKHVPDNQDVLLQDASF